MNFEQKLEQALSYNPILSDAIYLLGVNYLNLKMIEEAIVRCFALNSLHKKLGKQLFILISNVIGQNDKRLMQLEI